MTAQGNFSSTYNTMWERSMTQNLYNIRLLWGESVYFFHFHFFRSTSSSLFFFLIHSVLGVCAFPSNPINILFASIILLKLIAQLFLCTLTQITYICDCHSHLERRQNATISHESSDI